MQQPRETALEYVAASPSLEEFWLEMLALKNHVVAKDSPGGRPSVWKRIRRRYEYCRLQHYYSIDRFFMRRRLRNATTHARVLNRHVIDHILEFVFGVFSTRQHFFRDHFTVTRVRGTAADVA